MDEGRSSLFDPMAGVRRVQAHQHERNVVPEVFELSHGFRAGELWHADVADDDIRPEQPCSFNQSLPVIYGADHIKMCVEKSGYLSTDVRMILGNDHTQPRGSSCLSVQHAAVLRE